MNDFDLRTRHEAQAHGAPRPERSAAQRQVRRNVWTVAPAGDHDSRYLQKVHAASRTLTGDRIFSHESAAVVLGLPVFGRWPEVVHLIGERRSGGRSQLDVVRHCLGLEDVPTRLVDGLLVTSPARTVFDLSLTRSFERAVVVADAAIRDHPGAADELAWLVDAYGRRRGHRRARAVAEFADPLSESVGESVSRVRIDALGFARPQLQVPIVTDGITEFGDFGWEEVLGLGEFDGETKYRLDRYRRGGTAEDIVIREKNRENRMRRQRPRFARWDTQDLRAGRLELILLDAGIPKRDGR